MSRQLIESIVSNNMLEANDMVEAKLAEIRERKMYEMKRMFAAKMHEAAGGGMTKSEMEAKRKAGYKKASDVLGDPSKTNLSAATKKYREGKEAEKKSEKKSWFPKINMSKERKIGEQAIDEAGLGYGAQIAHDPYMSSTKKKMFMAIRKFDKKARVAAKGKAAETEAPEVKAPKSKNKKKSKDADYQRPGMIKRNINTLMGQEPGHVDNRSPKEKLYSKGGRAGKAVRAVAGGVGRAVGSVVSDLGGIGTSRL
jgi:hypothetical protein